jgi:hypothetical protein
MDNYIDRIIRQIYGAVIELDATFEEFPTKIILGIDVYNLIYRYIKLCYAPGDTPSHFATLFNIPLSVDTVNVNRICVCVDNNPQLRKEVFIDG